MKTITSIFLVALMGAALFTFAGKPDIAPKRKYLKTVSLDMPYQKVLVGKNLKVVFITSLETGIKAEGDSKFLEGLIIQVIDGTLRLSCKRSVNRFGGTIFLPMKNLSEIELREGASVYSQGTLKCSDLTVYFQEDSHADIKNRGRLRLIPGDGTELVYDKNQLIVE